MTDAISHLFWDSCVFYAFLRDERAAYDIDHIAQYLREAREGKCRIYASTMVLAEVLPSHITKPGIGSFQDFLNDLQSAVILTSPSPDIMNGRKPKRLAVQKGQFIRAAFVDSRRDHAGHLR